MIEKTTAFKTSTGSTYATIEEAQKSEISMLVSTADGDDIPKFIMENRAMILDILTMKPSSKPRARKINGATKKRKPQVTPEQAKANLDANIQAAKKRNTSEAELFAPKTAA